MSHDDNSGITRRQTLTAAASLTALTACQKPGEKRATVEDTVIDVRPLGAQWETLDPFLFCVHHDDAYPAGNDQLGPAASLQGRQRGNDFEAREGWRMYHGQAVPGFPQHPHRGFETVTVVRRGLIDHADSLGATARYGAGDAQWLTAGAGIVHAEMFPLLQQSAPNPLELFQIWLNLPAKDKFVPPHFSMLWRDSIPVQTIRDDSGRATTVTVVAGDLPGAKAAPPPPHSWAARPEHGVAIWTLALQPGARWTVPAAPGTNRALYFFRGATLQAGARPVAAGHRIQLRSDRPTTLINGPADAELLMLQGRPIGEPVVKYGPFVMNTRQEIQQAFADYQRTGFGGWPWPTDEPVHPRREGRFAVHADGRREKAG